ncbi:MAG: peptidylprolyl isomerase [Euryarchaeota archaeon]|nr:peptidylprolyl isomerase [Euryarchaeota archaeon]
MKKQLVIIGIIALLVCVGLSGCNEQKTGNINENANENIISPTITSFTVTPNTINKGETAELRWVVMDATSAFIDNGIGGVALSGNRIISPTETTVYILTASNSGIQTAATTQIIVKNDKNTSGNRIAVIDTTMGTIRVELYEDKMPITTVNFIKLVNDGFYNGLIFHRIGANFMIQAGGYYPNGTRKSSPYGNIPFETSDVKHVDGAISMASTGSKAGGSAEFFICDGAQTFLDGNYAAFGVTIEGLDVVRSIAAEPHPDSGDGTGKPTTDIIINSITIVSS